MAKQMQERVLDFSYVINMVGDDTDALIAVFESFLTQLPVYLGELDQALVHQDWDKVARCAHKIKPVFTYLGCTDVRDLVQDIEEIAQNRTTLANIQANIITLKQHSVAINKLIEAEIDRLVKKQQGGAD